MALKSEFYELANAYLPKDGLLPCIPLVPLEEVVPTFEESEEPISDHSSSDEDYSLTNGTLMFGDMDDEDIGSTDDIFESSQDYTPSQNIKQDMETERQQIKKAAEREQSRARLNLEIQLGLKTLTIDQGVEPGVINASVDGDCTCELPDIRWNS